MSPLLSFLARASASFIPRPDARARADGATRAHSLDRACRRREERERERSSRIVSRHATLRDSGGTGHSPHMQLRPHWQSMPQGQSLFMHLSSSILLRAEAQATWTGRGAEWVLAWTATPAFATVALVPQQDWPARAAVPTAGTDLLDATLLFIFWSSVSCFLVVKVIAQRGCVCV